MWWKEDGLRGSQTWVQASGHHLQGQSDLGQVAYCSISSSVKWMNPLFRAVWG